MACASAFAVRNIPWNEDRFREALAYEKHYFDVEELFEEQEKVLCSFFKGKDVYFSAPTGYGKLLIFQAIPLEADFLLEQATMTSCILVVSPLQSLMLDQIQLLREKGISAAGIYADQTKEVLEENETGGIHTFIFPPQNRC